MNHRRPLPQLQSYQKKIPLTHWVLWAVTWIALIVLAIGTVWALRWIFTAFIVAFEGRF